MQVSLQSKKQDCNRKHNIAKITISNLYVCLDIYNHPKKKQPELDNPIGIVQKFYYLHCKQVAIPLNRTTKVR